MLPKTTNYGQYSNDNYGAHTRKIEMGTIELYYSYETIVAYCDAQDGLICTVNQWGVTTGKHLNWIQPDKKSRLPADKFNEMLKAAIARHIH